ncbi:MAG: DUF4405 domain-containing protein [Deltaproteobacteria bacterium]|jgi:hypothetical protein|nr:DUF4405 domain-containing protein [Deltaproteobacteria bacterium]
MNSSATAKSSPQTKARLRLAIDLALIMSFLSAMPYMVLGERHHEWIGVTIFFLLAIHLIFNRQSLLAIFKGHFFSKRAINIVIYVLAAVAILGLIASGVLISRYVFSALSIPKLTYWARLTHLLFSYWGFFLVSLHLGYNWGHLASEIRMAFSLKPWPKPLIIAFRSLIVLLGLYGVYAIKANELLSYMFLKSRFVFFDLERSLGLYILDYAAMMAFGAFLGYGLNKLLSRRKALVYLSPSAS